MRMQSTIVFLFNWCTYTLAKPPRVQQEHLKAVERGERGEREGRLSRIRRYVLVFCNITNKVCKGTDTAVAFTQEYSRVTYPLRNVSTLSTGSGSSKDTHLCRIGGMRGFSEVQNLSLVKI